MLYVLIRCITFMRDHRQVSEFK